MQVDPLPARVKPITQFGLRSLDAFHEALIIIYFYHYAITNFGDYDALQQSTWYVLMSSRDTSTEAHMDHRSVLVRISA